MLKTRVKRLLGGGPSLIKDLAVWTYEMFPPAWRFGREYAQSIELFEESRSWSRERLEEYNASLLRKLVKHAYDNTPYYRRVFDERGLKPSDISTREDLKKLPFLTKNLIRDHGREMIATDVPDSFIDRVSTSGSTGAPLDFCIDKTVRAFERGLVQYNFNLFGYEKGDRVADISAQPFTNPKRLTKYVPFSRILLIAMFNMRQDNMEEIFRKIEKFRPAFLLTFPSTLDFLSDWMERKRKRLPSLKCVMTSSETLYPSILERAKQIFDAPIMDYYGQSEEVAHAAQCEQLKGYHVMLETCVIELEPEESGKLEMVGTSLRNLTMPLIRYRTGDMAEPSDEPCPCGRPHPTLAKIQGRISDQIVTPEGGRVISIAMDFAFFGLEEIKEAQIIQEEVDLLRVLLRPVKIISHATTARLEEKMRYYLNSDKMRILFQEVKEIPRTSRGKKLFVVSRL